VTLSPSPDQRRAVEAGPGPMLVVAGPGAGKTWCLIARVGHLVAKLGYSPERICAVTFTNKAAAEIAGRLEREVGEAGRHVTRGTLHRLCLAVLRQYPVEAGLRPGFGIADEEYQKALLQRLRVPEGRRPALLTLFGRHRMQLHPLAPDDAALLEEYTTSLRRRNLLDFDEIILRTHELFRAHEDILARVAGQWDALLVDEFQDLSATQYAIIRQLGRGHRHVFAVGDDEQSIYAWAGADPKVLVDFQHDFEIAEPVVLEENRRSARHIFALARRILRANPQLFDKDLRADRESPHPVRALTFPRERDEAAWIVGDLLEDRARHDLAWGDFAILYRRHQVGQRLEQALLEAGIPVRTARGRALADDPVIGEVLGALRILANPGDPVAVDALARRVLPEHLLQRVSMEQGEHDLLAALRMFHRLRRGDEAERKAAMRFVYHVENLPAMLRAATSLGDLVDALLLERPGTRRNLLEDRADELSDPLDFPGARELAADLARVRQDRGVIHVRPATGLDLALQGMLQAAGWRVAEPGDPIRPHDFPLAADPGAGLRLFKALQLLSAPTGDRSMRDCVTFDLETTDNDVTACGIIEIGAARVRDGHVTDTFHALVRPGQAIAAPATRIHGYTDADVADAPSFAEVWPAFRTFIGRDVLVAHNGVQFDVPVLRRHLADIGAEPDTFQVLDTLPMARAVTRQSASLESLAQRFGVETGRAHHALDDAVTLAHVLHGLTEARAAQRRRTGFLQGLEWLGLALALDPPAPEATEARMLATLSRYFTLGRYSHSLEAYQAGLASRPGAPPLAEVIDRLGGRDLQRRLRRAKTAEQRYPASVARLRALLELVRGADVEAGMIELLEMAALSVSDGFEKDAARLNLLTLHATKGLEFSRVYIVGVEDFELPGYHAMVKRLEDEFPEARRLLYVGMTRARDRLVLTRAERRADRPTGGTAFLDELGLTLEQPSPEPAAGVTG
jgi:DNA polymerase III epsilon subunit family exonuclease